MSRLRTLKTLLFGHASLLAIGLAFAYGVAARHMAKSEVWGEVFGVMTVAFFGFVPIVLGAITTRMAVEPSKRFRTFGPWVPLVLVVLTLLSLGWEGTICVVMAMPLLMVLASIGGTIGMAMRRRGRSTLVSLMALPYLFAPLEQRLPTPDRVTETVNTIEIAAPPSVVWPLVASVDTIRPHERRRALFLAIGFPEPVSATLSHPGVGGVRVATFEGGLVFTETVTTWEPGRRLSFTIDHNGQSLPPTTLDEHVTLGGPHFDVMDGTYELFPIDGGRGTRLVLRSTHRISTRFNPYAGWWANRIMSSIQGHIMAVHKSRAEQVVAR